MSETGKGRRDRLAGPLGYLGFSSLHVNNWQSLDYFKQDGDMIRFEFQKITHAHTQKSLTAVCKMHWTKFSHLKHENGNTCHVYRTVHNDKQVAHIA